MDGCRMLLQAVSAGVSVDDILAMDGNSGPLTRRLSRLIRLGLVDVYEDGRAVVTPSGRHVLSYIEPPAQWQFLRESVAQDEESDVSLSAFEMLTWRILAHVPATRAIEETALVA